MERAEVARVKAAVKANLKRTRSMRVESPPTGKPSDAASDDMADKDLPVRFGQDVNNGVAPSLHSRSTTTSYDALSPIGPTLPRNSSEQGSLLSEKVYSYREAELLMHYIDYIFPLQFRFHTPDLRSGGRGWLFWLLVKTGPLYHAALSLSALHLCGLLGDDAGEKATELTLYHAQALTDLHHFLREIQESGNLDQVSQQIQILSCGVSLISFELFRGGASDWRLHLDALASLPAISDENIIYRLASSASIDTPQTGEPPPGLLPWQRAALSFLVPVVLWFDLLACASTGKAPRVPYQTLLDSHQVDLEGVMGCENWVMRVIGDLATLSDWKTSQIQDAVLSIPQLVSQSCLLERRLEQGLRQLESSDRGSDHPTTPARNGYPSTTTRNITRIFAAGALVYLHVIVSGAYPGLPEIRHTVSRSLDAIECIENPQMIRGLIWPVCISACVAEPDKQPFFERAVSRAIGESRDFGNCETVLGIMRTCWRMQDADKHCQCDWRRAMTDQGKCVLLV